MNVFFRYFGTFFFITLLACNSSNEEYGIMCAVLRKAETIYQHPDGERFDSTDADTLLMLHELECAAAFFAEKKDFEKTAKVSLYSGYALKEINDMASAIKFFKDAEHYGNIAKDTLTVARAQYNIARVLFYENMYDESISLLKTIDSKFGDNHIERAFVHNLMATSYIVKKEYEIAELCLQKSLEYAEKEKSTKVKSMALNNYSVLYRQQRKYKEAIDCLLKNIESETDSAQMLMFNLNMGNIYIYDNQYDSAAFYIKKAQELADIIKVKPTTKVSIYFSLYYIAKKQGNYQLSLSYHEQHESLQYQIQKELEKNNIYRIQRQYDYEALQNRLNKQIIDKQRVILIFSFILLIVSTVVIVLLVHQKNILKENKEIKQKLEKTKEELQNSIKLEIVEKELSRQLHLIITANRISERADDFKKEWKPLIHKINNEKDNMFEAALLAIECVYPDMYSVIRQKYPDLNDTEAKVLLLSCSDLTNAEIGYVIGLTVHSVNKSKSEIRRKIVS